MAFQVNSQPKARIFKSFSQRSFFKFHKMFFPGCGPSIFSKIVIATDVLILKYLANEWKMYVY